MYEFDYFNDFYEKNKHYAIDTKKIIYMTKTESESGDYELNIYFAGCYIYLAFDEKQERDKLFDDIYKKMEDEKNENKI